MKKKQALVLAAVAVFLAACAASPGGGTRRSARVITAEEIAGTPAVSAEEAIRLLRPQWLNLRGAPSTGNPLGEPPVIYVDRIRDEDPAALRRVRARDVERMEYLSPSDATNRLGTNHRGGAILVTTRGG